MKKVLILLLWLLPSCSVVIFAQTQRIAGTVVVGDGQPPSLSKEPISVP